MIELAQEQRRALRAAAHHLNPVVSIAQKGLTATVLKEIDNCLKAHELIKVRLYGIERADRDALFAEICTALDCAQVQHIGNLLVLWREKTADDEKSAPATRRGGKPLTKKQAAAASERRRRVVKKTRLEAAKR
ncbi:YhbY family RNA-binding protein [Sulfurisoma sediminicola]|uniref:Putative YhbY family RNA-binding protein n=1 Tax=Sulfurisoma sediminicola TaxID=1381557 RepID=A0A497XAH0_9PROT|nr:YhbY family RNA-binding protein [Sulfurisoma sediminicola]RLJ63535.1 putative YhbY family RNA-binding protein [Sulfurisoma sediminicola]